MMDAQSNHGSTGHLSPASGIGGGMHHSFSTPVGVDGGGSRTPPPTPKRGGKMLAIRIQMLDDTVTIFQIQAKAIGKVLFDQVCKQLHLLEADYFGLEYADTAGTRYWLDLQKPLSRQLGLSLVDPLLYFCVKFYTPDPGQLEEEFTRYLFCLQVKRDLAQGVMQCNENTAALMASYIVQAECGDFVTEDYPDHTYLSTFKFIPSQDHDMERRIMENHKKHAGQSPAEADLNLLETARRCEFYGIKMHPAKDHENIALNLAVAHMGILVFQNHTKINTFSWAKIRKISFKRKRFLIKLHPEGFAFYKDAVEFLFEGRNECKNFWKKCVENHGFFRCSSVKNVSRHKTRVLSRGSSFRYSGKTQKQIIEFVRDNYVKRQAFQRSASFRHSSAHSSATNMHSNTVGNSISAHPLLPLGDTNLSAEAAKLSASLGSTGWQAAGADHQVSPTTRSACRPRGTSTTWNAEYATADSRAHHRPAAGERTETRPPVPQKTTSSQSSPRTTPSPETLPITRPTQSVPDTDDRKKTGVSDAHRPPYNLHQDDLEAAVRKTETGITQISVNAIKTPCNNLVKSEGSLDQTAIMFAHQCISQTQSQNDVDRRKSAAHVYNTQNGPEHTCASVNRSRRLVQRSASCKDLYDYSFEETGQAKRRVIKHKQPRVAESYEHKLEAPITRYDDHKLLYSTISRENNLEIHQDIIMTDQKVYSSSYPGTTSYSQESMEDPGNYDLKDSQEDLSHDSYELLQKSDDDYDELKLRRMKNNARSCSLDSGNYLYSDTDSDGMVKCKSSSDVQIFMTEDPRDLPREKIPRKSDGSFYKTFKQNSRQSSLESKSDYYESKTVKSSKERGSSVSRTSSQESKNDYDIKKIIRTESGDSRTSSFESHSEYFDAASSKSDDKSRHDYDRKIVFERNYGMQKPKAVENGLVIPSNVEPDQIICKSQSSESSMTPSQTTVTPKSKTTHIWPENIRGMSTEISDWNYSKPSTDKSTDSESNIFSFDEDKIQSIRKSDNACRVVPDLDLLQTSRRFQDVFVEFEPRKCREPIQLHQPIERTKSDPNSLARQRPNLGARRLLLMHQKSIDLTPAESSDDEYLYKQIPSAPPIMKCRGSHFEMPSAEFGHFDILKREIEGQKIKFEVPKEQFEEFGAKTQSDFMNLPPKSDEIPYMLHKRHIINANADNVEVIKTPTKVIDEPDTRQKSPIKIETESSFLFTQNIDLSKIDPVTLELDKNEMPIHHLSSPKRDITHIDPVLLETLNSKLSQIESDSPNSSKTESAKPQLKLNAQKEEPTEKKEIEVRIEEPIKTELKEELKKTVIKDKLKPSSKPKRIIKPRMQPNKGKVHKTNKTKVRITSFSSDDESLDSDDVFGSAEATPTRIEFSPPQMRKEMESILKFESERKYLQYTMSSTEVEGSPPQTRKKAEKIEKNGLEATATELRRISERSISIPSSEDDFNIKTADMQTVFVDATDLLTTVHESDDKSLDDNTLEHTLVEDSDDIIKRDKLLLQSEIENDIKNLQVPPRTTITEIISPSLQKKCTSPLLFAHARLNLSEGSAFTMLQKQQNTESPLSGRRAISLDAPVIPVSKLPPLNAFSSKDDTVEEDDQAMVFEAGYSSNETQPEKLYSQEDKIIDESEEKENSPMLIVPEKSAKSERDQTVPDVPKVGKSQKIGVSTRSLSKVRPKTAGTPKTSKEDAHKTKSKPALPVRTTSKQVTSKPKAPLPKPPETTQLQVKANVTPTLAETKKSLLSDTSLSLPEVKRTKSQETEPVKKQLPKDRPKSLEKLDIKRMSSKERSKSQEEGGTDISKRREKQQILYETAIKQTKSLKSPVKDVLPVFPQVEETVRERHGKLEISINTIDNTAVPIEEAIIITKSPKKLDKKIDKFTKSLELNLTDNEDDNVKIQRLGKSLDLDDRPRTSTDSEFEFNVNHDGTDLGEDKKDVEEVEKVVLEGTSLDVWISVDDKNKEVHEKLADITVIQPDNFFQESTCEKPPDIAKVENVGSSDSQVVARCVSEGAAASSKVSEMELEEVCDTIGNLGTNEIDRRTLNIDTKPDLVKDLIIRKNSNESLTEVSDIRHEMQEIDKNTLSVKRTSKEALLNLSIERSRSEDTASWMTMECDEFVGTESSFDLDNESPDKIKANKMDTPEKDGDRLQVKSLKMDFLKRSSDQSRSSDTTGSWTSGEKELSPNNVKDDESSLSCSMGRVVGLSQPELFSRPDKTSPDGPRSPRSPRSPRMVVLGRTFTIDEDFQREEKSSSDEAYEIPRDLPPIQDNTLDLALKIRKPYPFEQKWSNDSELTQKLHRKLSKRLSSGDKGSLSSIDDSYLELSKRGKGNGHRSLNSIEKLSTESRTSLDTESSSGSLGAAVRLQKLEDIPRELSSTWKPFPLDSSGSESFDDGILPPDQDMEYKGDFLCRDNSVNFIQSEDVCKSEDLTPTPDDTEIPEDLANFANNYRNFASNIQEAVSINLQSMSGQTGFLSRTLSRISERSTNSEKSSLEDESTKASSGSGSMNDESMDLSNRPGSFSSESPSNAAQHSEKSKKRNSEDKKAVIPKCDFEQMPHISNLLQRQISDDRRTSAEMAELSMDDIEIITSERGLKLRRQGSDDTIIDEECFETEYREEKHGSSSQESDEWPLPDIPGEAQKKLMALHEVPSSDTSQQTTQLCQTTRQIIPKTFGLRASFSLKSQDSEQWPSPPSSVTEPVEGKVETYYVTPPEEPCRVTVDSLSNVSTQEGSNSDNENRTIDMETEKTHTYENVATEQISGSLSESLSAEMSGVKIVLPNKSGTSDESNSEDDNNISNLNDDVFVDTMEGHSRHELRPPTVLRRSTTSDESSHSGRRDHKKGSYSDEDCTSSMGTNLEDGTVRFALKPTKCTHSSHSEDTSIALSFSEWSNSTNTVKFQNLSSNSGTTKSSSGLKSEENSLTDMAQSISEWSNSNSKVQSSNLQFQKISGDSTLTDRIPSEKSGSDSKNLASQSSTLGFKEKLTDDVEIISTEAYINLPIGLRGFDAKIFSKSTERPVKIPMLSDTEKSSSSEHKTVHSQRYDKDKQASFQMYQGKSLEGSKETKTVLKLSKCSPYYSSSLSSESTPLASTSPVALNKTATVPLTRTHRNPISKCLFQAKSPPSENDSTSSLESPKCKTDRDRRGYRRRRQTQTQRKPKLDKEYYSVDEYIYVEHDSNCEEYSEYVRNRNMEEMASRFQYETVFSQDRQRIRYSDVLEEGYYPDGDSQSGSDIFRMEKEEDEKFEVTETFDLSLIPPPLLEDDFEDEQQNV